MPITMDNMRILLSMVLLFSILVTVDDMTVLRILYSRLVKHGFYGSISYVKVKVITRNVRVEVVGPCTACLYHCL